MQRSLLDSGFVAALIAKKESKHLDCKRALAETVGEIILPSPILVEVAYIVMRSSKRETLVAFLNSVADGLFTVVHPDPADIKRAAELIIQYADARIDFVDCVIIAMAERLDIERILTVDQRDFRMVRPQHIPTFTILP